MSETQRAERERVRDVYHKYEVDPYYRKIWSNTKASQYMLDEKWIRVREVLALEGIDLEPCRILDLGAGDGAACRRLTEAGARPQHIVAFDLLEHRARQASRINPGMQSIVGDACRLPFHAAAFDIVYQSTMLSSVISPDLRRMVALEIQRVLTPGGAFISYDTRYPNPWNRNTRPLKAAELKRLFPEWRVRVRSVTGIPQLIRLLAPASLSACRAIASIPPLRSHLLALARKP